MRVVTLKPFDDTYATLPENIKRKVAKQIRFLAQSMRHPSLHAKKYDETNDIWQARIDKTYRFYFKIEGNTYILTKLTKHTD